MKLEARTIQILKNFSTLNQSILFKPGSTLRTLASHRSVFAVAKIKETFSKECAIYDIPKFISVLSLFNEPNLDFKDNWVEISKNHQKVKYCYTPVGMITAPPDKTINLKDIAASFLLTEDNMSALSKAMNILSVPSMIITSEKGHLFIQAANIENPSGDSFSIDLSNNSEKDFAVVIKGEYLRFLPAEYTVELSAEKNMARFYNDELEYFVATEASSRIGS